MKKIRILIFAIAFIMMLTYLDSSAIAYYDLYMKMDIPEGFEKIENTEDYTTNIYVNTAEGRQISIVSKFNFNDADYSGLSDVEIWQIEREADLIFIPEGSDNFFITEPVASRAYADTEDGTIDGVRVRASYFDKATNMEVYSTVYFFSDEARFYGISFVSYDSSEYWYKECLESLKIYGNLTDEEEEDSTEKDTEKNASGFSTADFFEGLGKVIGIGIVVFLILLFLSSLSKKK